MFFYISKIVWFFLQPSAASVWLIVLGLVISKTRLARLNKPMMATGAIALMLIAFSPLGRQLILPLEDRYPLIKVSELNEKEIDGIVVLGGTIHMYITDERGVPSIVSGAERLIEAVKIAKRFPKIRILLAGGPNTIGKDPTPDSDVIKQLMVDMGVNSERIEVDSRSKNTWQNAVFAKQIAKPKENENWYLITSAYHMPRAMGCFQKAGFKVKAYPVDYLTGGRASQFYPFYYALDGVTITDIASKEWLGLLSYWVTGRVTELFPGPKG